jgi:hydrogenase maturation protease
MKRTEKTLVVGFGNVLRGDDGFGVEVLRRLAHRLLLPHVELLEVGIGGMHFILKLLEGFTAVIVVDAIQGQNKPGTLCVFSPTAADLCIPAGALLDPHFAEPTRGLQLAAALGLLPDKVTLVGCEPEHCEVGLCLTWTVNAAVEHAVATICNLVGAVQDGH